MKVYHNANRQEQLENLFYASFIHVSLIYQQSILITTMRFILYIIPSLKKIGYANKI